jgi:uridine kinase
MWTRGERRQLASTVAAAMAGLLEGGAGGRTTDGTNAIPAGAPMSRVTVGIAGGTGAGKTTVVQRLAEIQGDVTVLDMDSYYLDRSRVSRSERAHLNFDEPGAFDIALLVDHVRELGAGRAIEKPRYSFIEHTRVGWDRLYPADVIVVEGLFALWWEQLRNAFDLKVYVEAPERERLRRRIERDVEYRGRSEDSVRRQYQTSVRPMHEIYVAPTTAYADLVLVNDQSVGDCVRALCGSLGAIVKNRRSANVGR